MSPRNNIGRCKGEDQPIEVSASILEDLGLDLAVTTIIEHESDECPNCTERNVRCSPIISNWRPQSGRIVAVISQKLKE